MDVGKKLLLIPYMNAHIYNRNGKHHVYHTKEKEEKNKANHITNSQQVKDRQPPRLLYNLIVN